MTWYTLERLRVDDLVKDNPSAVDTFFVVVTVRIKTVVAFVKVAGSYLAQY